MIRRFLNRQITVLTLAVVLLGFGITGVSYADNRDQPHYDDESTARFVAENVEENTNIGNPVSAHSLGTYYRYLLGGTDAASFTIDENYSQLKTATELDYETKSAYSVTVTVQSGSIADGDASIIDYTDQDSIAVTININNANDPPSLADGVETSFAVEEHSQHSIQIASLAVEDPEGDSFIAGLIGDFTGSFGIEGRRDHVELYAAKSFDYETQNSYTVTLLLTDARGLSSEFELTIEITDIAEDEFYQIVDANLDAAIQAELGLTESASEAEMLTLTSLTATRSDIYTLSGLQFAENLETLIIWGNNISDDELTHLSGLTHLDKLQIGGNDIQDFSDLDSLSGLETLGLGNSGISDIRHLSEFPNLKTLILRNNSIEDIEVLASLDELTLLDLRDNEIEDVEPLWNLSSLETLKLANNSIDWTTHLYQLETDHQTDIDIAVSEPWDVNEDGSVNTTDSDLVSLYLVFTTVDINVNGTNISAASEREKHSRFDIDFDGDVDQDDVDLVEDNYDVQTGDGAVDGGVKVGAGAPLLLDANTLRQLDPVVLELRLEQLRAESDGSLTYLQAIALLESVLAEMRPEKTALLTNYPNPFNPETWLPYHLANASDVRITIYDARGSVVRRLGLGHQTAGYYTSRSRAAYWDGANAVGERVASGIYFYQLEADNHSFLRKMLILK